MAKKREIGGFGPEIRASWQLSAEMMAFRSEILAFRSEILAFRSEIGAFRSEIGAFRSEIGAFRSKILAFRAQILGHCSKIMGHSWVLGNKTVTFWRANGGTLRRPQKRTRIVILSLSMYTMLFDRTRMYRQVPWRSLRLRGSPHPASRPSPLTPSPYVMIRLPAAS